MNGGCLPRITCVPVYAHQTIVDGIIFPNCVEVHRCSGCCQEAQFSCEPTKIDYVSFSPVKPNYFFSNPKFISRSFQIVKFEYGDGPLPPIAPLQPFRTENHTECTCKCKLSENACPSTAQVCETCMELSLYLINLF